MGTLSWWYNLPTTDGLVNGRCGCGNTVRTTQDAIDEGDIICEACKNPREFEGNFHGD